MTDTTDTALPAAPTQDLVVTRIVDAPLELVWQAWTDPQHVMRWWGPQHFTSPSATVDLQVGGRYVFAMQAPPEMGGGVSYTGGTYQQVVEHELLEFTQGITDEHGEFIDPASIGLPPDFPPPFVTSVRFRRRRDMTELTIVEHDWPLGQMYVFSLAGMQQSMDKLAVAVQTD
jgi:uncharacterized protein YndB with AHSA1/START domain